MNTENLHKVLVRMDKDLHERIKTLAEIEHRSVNSQINIMLEKSLKKKVKTIMSADAQRAANQKRRAAIAKRPTAINKAKNIAKMVELFENGQVVNESKLPRKLDRMTMKSHIKFLKENTTLDIITINRGRKTIGWILSDFISGIEG